MRDEKLHAVVARSTFASEKVKNTAHSEHFWKLSCRTSARRCGAKHISKSKGKKLTGSEPFWKLRCWREAHLEVKMYKAHHVQSTFGSSDVQSVRRCGAHISKSKCTKHLSPRALFGSCDVEKVHDVVARSTFRSQK